MSFSAETGYLGEPANKPLTPRLTGKRPIAYGPAQIGARGLSAPFLSPRTEVLS